MGQCHLLGLLSAFKLNPYRGDGRYATRDDYARMMATDKQDGGSP